MVKHGNLEKTLLKSMELPGHFGVYDGQMVGTEDLHHKSIDKW